MMADVVEGLADTMVATGAGPSMPGDHGQKRQAGTVGLRYEPPGKTKDRTSSAHAAPARNERIAMDWRILDDLNSPGRGDLSYWALDFRRTAFGRRINERRRRQRL
jgi:hypothetical protein